MHVYICIHVHYLTIYLEQNIMLYHVVLCYVNKTFKVKLIQNAKKKKKRIFQNKTLNLTQLRILTVYKKALCFASSKSY